MVCPEHLNGCFYFSRWNTLIPEGLNSKNLEGFVSLFLFLLYFVPTPGGSGAAEGGAAAVFRLLVPWNLAGLMAVSWRFLTEYTGIFLGTWVALRYLGWNLAEQLLQEKGKDEEDNGDSL